MRYTDRLTEAGIAPSVGSRGDSYDNALAESIIGLFKTEVIQRKGPWRHVESVEFATLNWVDWFNTRRLLEPIGYVPPPSTKRSTMRPSRQMPSIILILGVALTSTQIPTKNLKGRPQSVRMMFFEECRLR